jgi:hypothetical protein
LVLACTVSWFDPIPKRVFHCRCHSDCRVVCCCSLLWTSRFFCVPHFVNTHPTKIAYVLSCSLAQHWYYLSGHVV